MDSVDEGWLSMADKIISKNAVLLVEKGTTQSQLVNAMSKYHLSKIKGNATGNNVMIYFDANGFGESITAPHLRKPPIQSTIVQKMWKAVKTLREDPDSAGLLAPGDVLVLVNGGRKSDIPLLNMFGMGKDRKAADKGRKEKDGKTLTREITLAFTEKSVQARKFRKKSKSNCFLNCSQKAHIFWNGNTHLPQKAHKYLPDATNMSDFLGPFSLEAYQNLPKLKMKDKKEFWGARRRAVGGRTVEDDDEDMSDDHDDDVEAEEDEEVVPMAMELPTAGGGRGQKGIADEVVQCINYQQLPNLIPLGFMHSLSAMLAIDLTPSVGDLAIGCVLEQTGYLGLCQTDYQRDFILTRLKKEVLKAMEEPTSKVYCPGYAKEMQQQKGELF